MMVSWRPEGSLNYFLDECKRHGLFIREVKLLEIVDQNGTYEKFMEEWTSNYIQRTHNKVLDLIIKVIEKLLGIRDNPKRRMMFNDRSFVLFKLKGMEFG